MLISFLRGSALASAYQRMQKISAKVDGMIIAEGIADPEQLAMLAARVPISLIAAYPEGLNADVIRVDNRSGHDRGGRPHDRTTRPDKLTSRRDLLPGDTVIRCTARWTGPCRSLPG